MNVTELRELLLIWKSLADGLPQKLLVQEKSPIDRGHMMLAFQDRNGNRSPVTDGFNNVELCLRI
jgi:hypothetical protein